MLSAGFLLVVVGDARSLVEDRDGEILMVDTDGAVVDRKLEVEEEDRVGGLVTGLAMTLITNMIRDQILNILGRYHFKNFEGSCMITNKSVPSISSLLLE